MQKHQHNVIIAEYGHIVLTPPFELLPSILLEAPKSKFRWILNGIFMEVGNRTDNSLEINNANINDSGIYMLMLYRITKQKNVLKVVAVAVKSNFPNINTRVSLDIKMTCHGVVLGKLYICIY